MLGFPWISLADSGLFNGLRAKKIKFSLALTTRVSGCVLTGLKRFPVLVPSLHASALPRPFAARPFSGGQRQDSIGLGFRKGID
jgi:hypothetical protein